MLIPKSYKIRHGILQLLTDKRSEQQLSNLPVEKSQLTIEEIANNLRFDRKDVDQQLNVLWENKEVINIVDNQFPNDQTKTKYMVLSKGISTASSKTILNDGKAINASLFNNYSSGVFQIIVGIIAIWTIIQSTTSIDRLETQSETLKTVTTKMQQDIIRIDSKLDLPVDPQDPSLIARKVTFRTK